MKALAKKVLFCVFLGKVKRIRNHLKRPLRDYPSEDEDEEEEESEESEKDGNETENENHLSPNSPDEAGKQNPIISNRPHGEISSMSPQNETTEVCIFLKIIF